MVTDFCESLCTHLWSLHNNSYVDLYKYQAANGMIPAFSFPYSYIIIELHNYWTTYISG